MRCSVGDAGAGWHSWAISFSMRLECMGLWLRWTIKEQKVKFHHHVSCVLTEWDRHFISPLYSDSIFKEWTQSFKRKEEFAVNYVFDFGPSDLQKRRLEFALLNSFSVYPLGYLLWSPHHLLTVVTKRKKNEQNVSPRIIWATKVRFIYLL